MGIEIGYRIQCLLCAGAAFKQQRRALYGLTFLERARHTRVKTSRPNRRGHRPRHVAGAEQSRVALLISGCVERQCDRSRAIKVQAPRLQGIVYLASFNNPFQDVQTGRSRQPHPIGSYYLLIFISLSSLQSAALFVVCAVLACSEAKPAVLVDAAPAVVTATSSQYVARNFNGIASAPIVAPVAAAYTAPVAAAYTAPVAAAYTAPVAAAYSAPIATAAYTAPIASAYSAYPYTAAYTTVL